MSEYLDTGVKRIARLAPQYEYGKDQVSAIDRPILFIPPTHQNVASYYPSYATISNASSASDYWTQDDLWNKPHFQNYRE